MPEYGDVDVYPPESPWRGAAAGRRRVPVPDRFDAIYVPFDVMRSTSDVMRRFGAEWRECYVWWGGYHTSDGRAQVVTAFCPEISTDYGRVAFGVEGFGTLQRELRSRDQILIAELHTHPPGVGGQNEVDAAHAAAPYSGFVTIVVPDFARPYFYDLRRCHVYRYLSHCEWSELTADEIERTFHVEEEFVSVRFA